MHFSFQSLVANSLVLASLADATKTKHVTSEALQKLITIDNLLAGSQKLQDFADANGNNRAFGSAGHNATVDYLYNTLCATGYYDVVKQPFTEIFSTGTASLSVAGEKIEAGIMTYTPGGKFSGPLVAVLGLGCTPGDFSSGVSGKVVLVSRGECTFGQKSINAKQAGAKAVIIYNNVPDALSGTLGDAFSDYAPIVGISQQDGKAVLEKLKAGEVTVDLQIDAVTEKRVNYNVIAETKQGDHKNVLVLGGHTDSVAAGPGINDDGSGTIGVLNVAVALSKFKIKKAVRFAFWGAEEYGKLGSYYYIKQINGSETELSKIRAYLNFDMIASPNYVYGIYDGNGDAFNISGPAGSEVLEKDFEDFYDSKKVAHVPSEFSGRSDYAAFIENGIPSGGLFTGAEVLKTEAEAKLFGGQAGVAYDVNYHKIGDDIKNLNHDAFLLNTKAIANSVAKYAMSYKSFKPVSKERRRWDGHRTHLMQRASEHSHTHSGPCGAGGVSI